MQKYVISVGNHCPFVAQGNNKLDAMKKNMDGIAQRTELGNAAGYKILGIDIEENTAEISSIGLTLVSPYAPMPREKITRIRIK